MSQAWVSTVQFTQFTQGTPQERAEFIQVFGESLRTTGFVVVDSPGIGGELIQEAYGCAQEFFGLPEATKRSYFSPGATTGYTPFGTEHAKDNPIADLKEFWHVGRSQNPWPREVTRFQPATQRLYTALDQCAYQLLTALGEYLQLPQLADLVVGGDSVLRIIHYPALKEHFLAGAVRASAHEDINFITLLPEATDSGLEICDPDGNWHPVTATAGQLIVDSGDMLRCHSQNQLPSTTHRVVNPSVLDRARYSMPFFVHPRPEVVLGGKIKAGEFLHQRLQENGMV